MEIVFHALIVRGYGMHYVRCQTKKCTKRSVSKKCWNKLVFDTVVSAFLTLLPLKVLHYFCKTFVMSGDFCLFYSASRWSSRVEIL